MSNYFTHLKYSFFVFFPDFRCWTLNELLLAISAFFLVGTLGGQPQDGRVVLTATDSACCYQLSYALQPFDPPYDAFELRLPAGFELSLLEIDLGAGWFVEELFLGGGYRFYRADFGPLPPVATNLLRVCAANQLAALDVPLEVTWSQLGGVLARDSLRWSCLGCNLEMIDSLVCSPAGGYDYFFRFVNDSPFAVSQLGVGGGGGASYFLTNEVAISDPVAVGDTSPWLLLPLAPTAEDSLSEFCFKLTARRQWNDLFLDCCTIDHCADLPPCDRCCQDSTQFLADLAAGFTVDVIGAGGNCTEVSLVVTPRQLTDCDTTRISRRLLPASLSISVPGRGNAAAQFGGLSTAGEVEICMEVSRTDFSGAACFDLATSLVCDTFLVNCQDTTVSVRETSPQPPAIRLYPNPTDGMVGIRAARPPQGPGWVDLYDANGRMLRRQNLQIGRIEHELDLGDLAAGLYLLHWWVRGEPPRLLKVIKR